MTDLFAGQPIASISTIEEAKSRLGSMGIRVREEYFGFILKNFRPSPGARGRKQNFKRWQSYGPSRDHYALEAYLRYIRKNPSTSLMCSEEPLPAELSALFAVPDYCKSKNEEEMADTVCKLFVGNAGNKAHLHFDGDYRHVLHYQICGSKRFILIPVGSSRTVAPIGHFSSFFLEHFSESDKRDLLNWTKGYDCVLHPGETLFIPAAMWHYVEYVDHALSFNIRFGRNKYTRFLSEKLFLDMFSQHLAAKMADPDLVEREYLGVFREIKAACQARYKNPAQKYSSVKTLLKKIYQRTSSDSPRGAYSMSDVDGLLDTYREWTRNIHTAGL